MTFGSALRPYFAAPCFLAPWFLALVFGALLPNRASAASITLRPSKDNTIFGPAPAGEANLSNGAGAFLFAGGSGQARILRSLVAFNPREIPAGAAINSVTLTFTINTPLNNANTVRLHRLLADWGEGSSVGAAGGGGGAPATNGDATWNARFFNTQNWTTPGGDFSATVSASQPVRGQSGTATFSTAGMTADVQAWMNNPASNFGWILVAQDETGPAVRFGSREGPAAPSLVIDYTVGGGGGTAPTFTAGPASQSVIAGGIVTFSATATGNPPPSFQWQKNGAPIPGATSATLTLAGVSAADAATYTVVASNSAGNATSAPAILTVSAPPDGGPVTARLSNLSVRTAMVSDQILIVGFSVSGGSRSILVRGVGPTLARFGVGDAMADPRLELYDASSARVAQNDDWGNATALSAAFSSVGAFALVDGSKDAAFLQSIDGTHTVQLRGTGAGVALVELYDSGTGNTPRLTNVSARSQVGRGDDILIVGFVIVGSGTKNILIRAVGPRLADLGVGGVLADPKLDVFRADAAAAVASNDNWDGPLAPTFAAVGAFSLTPGSRDAALVAPLTPGLYTVQVSGINNTTGEALVELYEIP